MSELPGQSCRALPSTRLGKVCQQEALPRSPPCSVRAGAREGRALVEGPCRRERVSVLHTNSGFSDLLDNTLARPDLQFREELMPFDAQEER
jgi:hypothetical protein